MKKVNIATEFCIFKLAQTPSFTLNNQFLILGPNLPKKCILARKRKNWTSSTDSFEFLDQISQNWCFRSKTEDMYKTKFQLKATILICLDQICQKEVFPASNRHGEHHRWILHIWISLGDKFQLTLRNLSFWSKSAWQISCLYIWYTWNRIWCVTFTNSRANIVRKYLKTLEI